MNTEPLGTTSRLDHVIEEFLARQRSGGRVSVDEFVQAHPDLADELREVLPALELMENLGPAGRQETGPFLQRKLDTTRVPDRLGEYRILREVGRGGMGVVYEAIQVSLGRHVALKVLPPHADYSPVQIERFRREAQSAARLHHTNIVPVYGVGEQDGICFYAMQFIQGQSLDSVLAELRRLRAKEPLPTHSTGHLTADDISRSTRSLVGSPVEFGALTITHCPVDREVPAAPPAGPSPSSTRSISSNPSTNSQFYRNVADIGLQVAEALAYAHGQGIVHRDIKPSNLMLDGGGTVWVTDFGLAKLEGSADLTNPGDFVGTLRYMAPEQLQGHADARSDVYSLGVTLYELATTRPAFADRDRVRLLDALRHRDPSPPRKVEATVPRDLETIILTAIAKEPKRRYQTVVDLAEDLRRFQADRPVRARRAGWLEHGWRWCRRNRTVASLLTGIALTLLAITAASLIAAVAFDRVAARAKKAEDAARIELWKSMLEEARALTLSQQPGQRVKSLALLTEALQLARKTGLEDGDELQFRNVALAALTLPDLVEEQSWKGLPHLSGWAPSWDFDAKFETYVRPDGNKGHSVVRVSDGTILGTIPDTMWPARVRMSPDGRYVVATARAERVVTLSLWCVGDGSMRLQFSTPAYPAADFDADSRRLAYVDARNQLVVKDLQSGAVFVGKALGTNCVSLRFSPDGRWIALAQKVGNETVVFIRDSRTGEEWARLTTEYSSEPVAWHPGSRLLAFSRGRTIGIYDVAERRIFHSWGGEQSRGISLAFDPTGKKLLSNDWLNQLRVWNVGSGRQEHVVPAWGPQICVSPVRGTVMVCSPYDDGGLRELRCVSGDEFQAWTAMPRTGHSRWHEFPPRFDLREEFLVQAYMPSDDLHAGLAFLDARTGETRARLQLPATAALGFDDTGHLLTCGDLGLCRWPRHEKADSITFGPPQTLKSSLTWLGGSIDRSGRVFGLAGDEVGLQLMNSSREVRRLHHGGASRVRQVDVSPDGRWVVNGNATDESHGVSVWEAETGRLAKFLPSEGHQNAYFSPDGQWLLVGGGGGRMWRVSDWTPGLEIHGHFAAMSPDGRIVAIGEGLGVVRLVRAESGRELARLTANLRERLYPHRFASDGGRLYVWSQSTSTYVVWDLRSMRKHLDSLGLDWNLPPIPDEAPAAAARTVDFVLGPALENLAARQVLDKARNAPGSQYEASIAQAIGHWRRSLELDPNQAEIVRLLSWQLSRSPGQMKNPSEAIQLAERAIELDPSWQMYFRRGEAYYFANELEKALIDYNRVIGMTKHEAYVYRARSECLDRLGRRAEAIADLGRSLELEGEHIQALETRGRWHAEAGSLDLAMADWRRLLKLRPAQHSLAIDLAAALLLGPPGVRDTGEAQTLIDRVKGAYPAGTRNPYGSALEFLTGVARYRRGDYAGAIETLDTSPIQRFGRYNGAALLFLAMCHHHLGENKGALERHEQAMAWRKRIKLAPTDALYFDTSLQDADRLKNRR